MEDPVAGGVWLNRPPVPVIAVPFRRDACLATECIVPLDGTGSYDPEDTANVSDIVAYQWYEGDVASGRLLNPANPTAATLDVTLPLGSHLISLAVTDSVGNMRVTDTTLVVSPADLALFRINRAEVEWNKSRFKVSGNVALPVGKALADVAPAGVITTNLGAFGRVPLNFAVSRAGQRWEAVATDGTQLRIDWGGEQFRYRDMVVIESEHIGVTTTTLEIKAGGLSGALAVDVAGATGSASIQIDGASVVASPGIKVDRDDDGEVEVELLFPLDPSGTITLSGALNRVIPIADHYLGATGRYQLVSPLVGTPAAEASLSVDLSLGQEGFSGVAVVGSADWRSISVEEWKFGRD